MPANIPYIIHMWTDHQLKVIYKPRKGAQLEQLVSSLVCQHR